jgi:8-oxo-dGTP pyrophosphatase MutT (NUDIX family)
MGGIEPEQTAEQAALNEIKEEAALTNVEIVHVLNGLLCPLLRITQEPKS